MKSHSRVSALTAAVIGASLFPMASSADMFSNKAKFSFDPDLTQSAVYQFQGGMEPAPIKAEPFFITPLLNLSFGRDSNVYLAPDNEQSSMFIGIGPSVNIALPTGPDQYYVNYIGNYGIYTSERDADYYDHTLALGALNDWTSRARSSVELAHQLGHDPVGSTTSAVSKPDEWHLTSLRGDFSYGAEGAQGQIEVGAGFGARRYDNNRNLTKTKDRNHADMSAAFLYRLGPATQALVEGRYSDIHYTSGGDALDSNETRLLVGAKWQMTSITSGTFKIGHVSKDFEERGLHDYSGLGWEGAITWSPLTYSRLNLALVKSPGESTGGEDYLLTRETTLSWQHDWTDLMQTTVGITDARDTFEGLTRKDSRRIYTAKATYGLARWLRVGAEIQHHTRNSNDDTLDYKRNLFLLTLEGSL